MRDNPLPHVIGIILTILVCIPFLFALVVVWLGIGGPDAPVPTVLDQLAATAVVILVACIPVGIIWGIVLLMTRSPDG